MKRWISLAALVGIMATAAPARAADFPLTTSSGNPKNGSRFLGGGGILFPWLNGHGHSSKMDAGRRNAAASSGRSSSSAATATLERRANRESTGVLTNFKRMSGSMFKK